MFKKEVKPLSKTMEELVSKTISRLQYEATGSRGADRTDGDVKPHDVEDDQATPNKNDGSKKKADSRKADNQSEETVIHSLLLCEKDKDEKLDPVNKKAVKKKFDDRKDKDIDNDGDVDDSDEYLHKRRKAISKALEEGTMMDAAKELEMYAKKSGGIDKADFMKSVAMMKKQDTKGLVKFVNDLDTEPRDKIIDTVKNALGKSATEKLFSVRIMREEVELEEESKTIEKVREIADKKQAMKIDGVMVDMFTASAITQIYDKVNDANRKKMDGLKITKLADLAMKMMKREEVELDEAMTFTDKEIKMAIGIASDKRYAKGNMTGAVSAIEKIKKGLSDHPQVQAVLKRQNESLDEAKNYEYKDGKVHISKANFRKVHKDYKNATRGKERMVVLDPKTQATVSAPVVFTEESLEEKKEDYTIYHKTFSSAVQHAVQKVKDRGYEVDNEDYDRKVAFGPRKPSKGKTNSYTINLMKNGKPVKQKLQMQVYYDEGRYELNMYIS